MNTSIYNEDELVPRSWINQEFIQTVLNQYEKCENIKLNDLVISPATLKGDHYGSIMFRCKVDYELNKPLEAKKRTFIIKTMPEDNCTKRDLLEDSGLFETEISMYSQTLPKVEKLLKEFGLPTKMGAELIYYSLEPHKVVVMEDLCEAGYSTLRGRYLTEDEVKLVYQKIAKFHAVTYMLSQTDNHEVVTKYKQGLFNNSAIMSMDMIRNGIENFIDMLKEYKEFAIYLEKVKIIKPHMLKGCMDLYNAYTINNGEGDIFVLNHGDFHMKNLMFKFNQEGQLEDVIMVDYQLNCFAPSTIDTTYSQFHILSAELRLRKNEFMLHYFTEFIKTLKNLKYEKELPRYSDFQIASYKYRYLALFILSTFLPLFACVIMSKPEDLKDVDSSKFIKNIDVATLAYKSPSYINDLRNYLPLLLREGYLD